MKNSLQQPRLFLKSDTEDAYFKKYNNILELNKILFKSD